MNERQLFFQHIGQTSDSPMALEIERAEGIYLYDTTGKRYIDLISGVSVSNVGHRNPKVVQAVKNQLDKYMHLMVYGEYIQSPQVQLAKLLTEVLPKNLNSVYLVNSGSEANEGALKLAKRYTRRSEIVAFKNAYHGSTHGALSIMGQEDFKNSFRPLLPDVRFLEFNNELDLEQISRRTACVIVEPIQAEAGIILPENHFLRKLRKKCTEMGALLIFDEIQVGFGRTGSLFAFEQFNVVPDILTLAKGLGGGMPIGAFVADKEIMDSFKTNPILGHITTFGGHPVSAAAALASLEFIVENQLVESVAKKGDLFRKNLNHKAIKSIRGVGLFLAIELENFDKVLQTLKNSIELGVVFDWFIFCDNYFRIAPPLIITEDEIIETCEILKKALD
jgi:acetylornithine/succinyldiaminopimelate/putrescine aminotransferase